MEVEGWVMAGVAFVQYNSTSSKEISISNIFGILANLKAGSLVHDFGVSLAVVGIGSRKSLK